MLRPSGGSATSTMLEDGEWLHSLLEWSAVNQGLPDDVVKSGCAV